MEGSQDEILATRIGDDLTGASVSRYAIRLRLGAGGMGEVYLADDTQLKRPVALKRLAPQLRADPRYHQRFLKEAERASALNHPHIASVYDVLEDKGELFLVMEYVQGGTLRQRLREPISSKEFLVLAVQCGEALQAAQQKGIVHGDIKPENIMLTAAGQVKILDFGVAKHLTLPSEDALTQSVGLQTASLCGTPAYMAPEVLLNKQIDGRADIFALGVVFYEALTRRHPFLADSLMATGNRILNEDPPPVTQINPAVPAEVERVVASMLVKDPAERCASAADLLADLRAIQCGVTAPGLGAPSHPRPRTRNRVLIAAATGLAALLVLTAIPLARHRLQQWWQRVESWAAQRPPPLAARSYVLVADFENRTGEPVFDHTLRELLTTALEQSRYINVFPSSQIPEVLQRMQRPATSRIDEAIGREMCLREDLQGLVLGSISRIGDNYLLNLKAVNPEGRSLFSQKEIAKGQTEVLPALDHLAAQLREQLGESLDAIRKSTDPLEQVTSRSLEAVRYFSLGKRQLYAHKFGEAQKLMQRAVELDPEFAMAYEYLAIIQYSLHRRQALARNLQRALELSHHLTERERHKILGDYHLLVDGDVGQAIDEYKVLLELYPDDYSGHANLAIAYSDIRQFDQAAAEAEAALRQRDAPVERDNLASYYFVAGRTDRAIQIEEQNLAAHPDDGGAVDNLGQFHLLRDEPTKAESYFQRLAQVEDDAVTGHRGLADLYWSQGRYGSALRELETALRLATEAGNTPEEARTRLRLAFLSLEQSERERARQQAQRAGQLTQEPELMALAGSVLAQAGDLPASQAVLSKLQGARAEPWASQLVRGELLLAQGNAQDAVRLFNQAGYSANTLMLESEARTRWAARQLPDAAAAYEQVLARQVERGLLEADQPAFHRVVQIYYRLGVLYQELGDRPLAQKNLERFLHYFRNADAEAPFASDARQRLKQITAKIKSYDRAAVATAHTAAERSRR